jgi:hypothetical protein
VKRACGQRFSWPRWQYLQIPQAQPSHPYPLPKGKLLHPLPQSGYLGHDLVAQDEGELGGGEFAVQDMQVSAADPAGSYP